jgi:hypothetical protein
MVLGRKEDILSGIHSNTLNQAGCESIGMSSFTEHAYVLHQVQVSPAEIPKCSPAGNGPLVQSIKCLTSALSVQSLSEILLWGPKQHSPGLTYGENDILFLLQSTFVTPHVSNFWERMLP